jgi:hypothetical protein
VGVTAENAGVLRLENVVVSNNSGGGVFVDGAGFDISGAKIALNGPGQQGATTWGGILINNPPAAGPKRLNLSTVQGNTPTGVSCSSGVDASGVLATGNNGVNIASSCGFSSCGTPSTDCGAQ